MSCRYELRDNCNATSKISARHHLSDYDHGRAVGRLEEGQSVTTVTAAMDGLKSVISRLKKAAEGVEILCESMPGVVVGTPHL
ncbi:hypothetical protein TNCV_4142131 [Trichonephila clavipes]|nr:hypothetical protein TNCV_4142131 [Trichonephila clavipes]